MTQGLELSPRLLAIAEKVTPGGVLADVGTDHGYLPVWLLCRGVIPRAVATDIHAGPLARGRETARRFGVSDRISFLQCDGLAALSPGQAETVVIAGMGGELISHILQAAPWTRFCQLLLQPMSTQPELRAWLGHNGYRILQEEVARERDRFYSILTVTGGEEPPLTPGELWAGRQRPGMPDPHRAAFLADLIARRRRAIEGMRRGNSCAPGQLAREEALLEELVNRKEEWDAWQR